MHTTFHNEVVNISYEFVQIHKSQMVVKGQLVMYVLHILFETRPLTDLDICHLDQTSWPWASRDLLVCIPSHHHWNQAPNCQAHQLKWVLGIQAQVLQVLYQLSNLPSLEILHKYSQIQRQQYRQIQISQNGGKDRCRDGDTELQI